MTVVRELNPDLETFQDKPVLIIEVMSESTRRIDEGEKRDRYLSIDSLQAHVLLEQSHRAVRVYSCLPTGVFVETIYTEPSSGLTFPMRGATLKFDEPYAGLMLEPAMDVP